MIDSIWFFGSSILVWFAAHPLLGFVIVVVIQIGLISALAALTTDRFASRQPILAYRIYLVSIVLVLLLVPLHLSLGGWKIHAKQTSTTPPVATRPIVAASSKPWVLPSVAKVNSDMESVVAGRKPSGESADSVERTARALPLESKPVAVAQTISPSNSHAWRPSMPLIFTGIYLAGFLVMIVRFAVGALRLANWSRRGETLTILTQAQVTVAANETGLPRVPQVRVVDAVKMPLVFGLLRPMVLLPSDFESWSAAEQRATLLHELMHIRRRDMIGQCLSMLMRTLFWFHPASRFLERGLQETREWATDQQVIQCGLDADRYAESLLSIVSRLGRDTNRSMTPKFAIAMSAGSGMEDRLCRILREVPQRTFASILAGPCSILALLLMTSLTTVRVELAVAQESKSTTLQSAETKNEIATISTTLVEKDESDLIARFKDCEVLTITGDAFDAIFTVSGQVVSPAGDPVAGAVVLLRESSSARIGSDFNKYFNAKDRHLLRAQDVFARTVSDADGKFEFRDAKAPAFPKTPSNSWEGDVIAAHPEFGIGRTQLLTKKELRPQSPNVTLTLRPTNTVSGRFIAPDNRPVADATVSVGYLFKQVSNRDDRSDHFDLHRSQLTPRVTTDQLGNFTISGIPEGLVASLSFYHPDWVDSYTLVATSQDVPLGIQQTYYDKEEVHAVPVEAVADPGVTVAGRVFDPDGKPVPDARVMFSSVAIQKVTSSDGSFRLRIPSSVFKRAQTRQATSSTLRVFMNFNSGFLSDSKDLAIEDLIAEKAITIELKRGVKVSGKVVTDDKKPLPDAFIYDVATQAIAQTNPDGTFEMLLSPEPHTLVVGTHEPGFSLPTRSEVYRVKTADEASKFPHASVNMSDGIAKTLPPIIVSKVKSLQVIVSLPDGKPAIGATAILKNELPAASGGNSQMPTPPRPIDKSNASLTNQLGRAELLPQGTTSDKAFVDVKLVTNTGAYDASVLLSQAVDGVLNVVLNSAWIVEGRVLIDGQPVAGAMVSIGQSTSFTRTVNGMTFTGFNVSNHQSVATDKDGWYRTAVPQGKQYSVSFQSLPDYPDSSPGIGYTPTPAGEGRLTVKDFAFSRGDQEIAGHVIDQYGQPVAGANVQVSRSQNIEPGLWVGHRQESQSDTDRSGRFHLRNMPKGSYQLRVSAPRVPNQQSASTMVNANTGKMDIEIVLATDVAKSETPRLQPRRIEAIQPTSEAKP